MAREQVEVVMNGAQFNEMQRTGLYGGRKVRGWTLPRSNAGRDYLNDKRVVYLDLELSEPEKAIYDQTPLRFEYKLVRFPEGLTHQEQGLNLLGAEGWELITVDMGGLFYFKRALLLDKS